VPDPDRTHEIRIRCPVHGFITVSPWEREIIRQSPFQRLRRIRQLGWTDQVYPGAMHTRFEHSLGVMQTITGAYDSVVRNSHDLLIAEGYRDEGLGRDRILVRLSALLHDVGHGPFSHAAEELMPPDGTGGRYKHERYSAAAIRRHFTDVIDNNPVNRLNWRITADEVARFVEGRYEGGAAFWRVLLTGHADADRMDYLLRDSYHVGVQYGRYDLERLVQTACAIPPDGEHGLRVGVTEGGAHAAESLVIARYMMFTQVYFHKTRVAYDHHLRGALREMLDEGQFPPPEEIDAYLDWDDWKVLGLLKAGEGGEHGRRLMERDHYREVYHTPEAPAREDLEELGRVRKALGGLLAAEETAQTSWYRIEKGDIPILREHQPHRVVPLSGYSSVVAKIEPIRKVSLYARSGAERQQAERIVRQIGDERP
jgi:uncharacterized protein